MDNDGVLDNNDNCPIVANSDQTDRNNNGVGDACENDCDGDSIPDELDACPCNAKTSKVDFRAIQPINLCSDCSNKNQPRWEFRDEGKEIHQAINSNAGIAIGDTSLAGVEFEGTIYIGKNWDNDWVGSIFSFQVKKYYSLHKIFPCSYSTLILLPF